MIGRVARRRPMSVRALAVDGVNASWLKIKNPDFRRGQAGGAFGSTAVSVHSENRFHRHDGTATGRRSNQGHGVPAGSRR